MRKFIALAVAVVIATIGLGLKIAFDPPESVDRTVSSYTTE
jgi:hypothetical protein